ncbi:hypothetical protein E5K00_02170 [Hymenobacter aquaticus]|uniref:Outer membrane protein beta-barrel domain-containing protein n=1 Tax=Hymenobacter aquaticus TaxID=1867101 RepID=A0A4Z0Q4J1_9BACT|nr:hypothetical protein [Hymenobacter aquaticus]TGE24043.1 hypothetical protein E5K00_02170 [Hymenobacter aquaticus]
MKRLLLLPGTLCFLQSATAQVAVSYFPFQSVLGVSSNPERRVWAGVTAETNTFVANVNAEVQALANLKRGEWVNYYAGPGVNINPASALNELPLINGYTLTLGARIKPLPAHRNVHVVFELAPYTNQYLDSGYLRTQLGLSYNFRPKAER